MPKYGEDLETYFTNLNNRNIQPSNQSIYSFGIKMINQLKMIHQAGYLYCDLKLENILINLNDSLPS